MRSGKLFKYLDVLQSSEWKDMLQFFKGTIGEHNDAFKLFSHIYDFRKKLSHKKLEITYVNQTLFPHLSRKSFQNIMSVLVKEIEEYWIVKDLSEDRARKELHRLEALNKRGLYQESDKAFDKVVALTDNNKNLDLWNDYFRLRAQFELYFSNNPIKSNQKNAQELIKSGIENIKSFSSNLLLYYQSELYNRQLIASECWKDELEDINLQSLENEDSLLKKSLLLQVDLLRNNYSLNPKALLIIIRDESYSIVPALKLPYFYHIRRYYILKVRQGNKSLISDLIELINWSIESHLLLYHGELDIAYFLSDLSILCVVEKNVEAEKYYHRNLDRLHSKSKSDGKVLGKMIVDFAMSKFNIVIETYMGTSFSSVSRRLQAAGMFLRASFEIIGENNSQFDYAVRNVSDFIRRNKKELSTQQVEAWKNFMFILKKIALGVDTKELKKLLGNTKDIIHRKWLENKIHARDQ